MLLIPIESLALALATVTHLRVLDRDPPVFGHPLPQPHAALGRGLHVLRLHLRQRLDVSIQRRVLDFLGAPLRHPRGEAVELHAEPRESLLLGVGIIPIDVQRRLDTGAEEQRSTRLATHLFEGRLEPYRHALGDLATGMTEQVDGVLNPPGPGQRAAIDRHAKGLGELAPIEGAARFGDLDGALEQAPVHIVADHAVAELLQSTLRERRLVAPAIQRPEHESPAKVRRREPNGLGVGHLQVALKQQRHAHQRRRLRLLTLIGTPIHRLELGLESGVEDFVAALSQEHQQLAALAGELQKPLFTLTPRNRRVPPLHRHLRRGDEITARRARRSPTSGRGAGT